LATRAGDRDAATEHWRAARQSMTAAGVLFDAAVLALAEAGSDMDVDDDPLGADDIATFERLRARPWVERARCRAARSIHLGLCHYRARWTGVPARGAGQMRVMPGVEASMTTSNTSANANTAASEVRPAGSETGPSDGDSERMKGSDTNIVISSG
jgi:hypothetical protein